MPDVDLILRARDGYFFKDARGWYTSDAGRTHSLEWPYPTTLLGALRSAFGRRREASRPFTPDEWEAQTKGVSIGVSLPVRCPVGNPITQAARLWPQPADMLLAERGGVRAWLALNPEAVPTDVKVVADRDGDAPADFLWFPRPGEIGKPSRRPPWWTDAELYRWVAGRVPGVLPESDREIRWRTQVHVSIDPKPGTALDGALFSTDVRESLVRGTSSRTSIDEFSIAVRVQSTDNAALWERTPIVLGGDGRLASAVVAPAELFDPVVGIGADASASLGLRVLVVTPAEFEQGWLPDTFELRGGGYFGTIPGFEPKVRLRSAIIDRPIAISGWDVARGKARSTRRLVPSGSVYFVTREDGLAFDASVLRSLWLGAWGGGVDSGLGRFVVGAWTPTKEAT